MPRLPLLLILVALSACEQVTQQLGLDEPQRREAKADAEGRAVGSACRQSGRAIEDCYSVYRWLPKASIFAGWREMNDYMLANNLNVVEPKLPPAPGPEEKKKKTRLADAEIKPEEKKSGDETKAGDKNESTPSAAKAASEEKSAAKH